MSELWIRIKQVLAKAWEIFQMLLGLAFILFLLVSCFSSDDKDDDYQKDDYEPYSYEHNDVYQNEHYYEEDDDEYHGYEEKWSPEGDYIGS
ncbi:hypothetical protein [Acinetobacter baumannii]|uniref:hypothetical protein n=1 Tax=Acinetobacter baumannii TaxID=470 RepID=UPI0038912CF8